MAPARLQPACKLKPRLVCLDVLMPNSNGLDVLKDIISQRVAGDSRPHGNAALLTTETVQGAILAGASGYVVKPFNAARVVDAVLQALQTATPAPTSAGVDRAAEITAQSARQRTRLTPHRTSLLTAYSSSSNTLPRLVPSVPV